MARRSHLSTFDWVRFRDFELVAQGADPSDRIRFTGHTRCVPTAYLSTIGTWGAYEVHDLVNDAEPDKAVVPVSEAAYRRFKARHRLLGRAQFGRVHGPQSWARAEVSFLAHERAQRAFEDNGCRGPIGVACDYARMSRLCAASRRSLGLMPVEVVLWTRVFDAMLAHNGFAAAEWINLDDDDKQVVWEMGGDRGPWSVERFLYGSAVRTLPDRDAAAAA